MSRTAEEWGEVAVGLPGWRWMPGMLALPPKADRCQRDGQMMPGRLPDPDDPATAGCLLALLNPRRWESPAVYQWIDAQSLEYPTLGRACIAAAEALGRWPGGEA